MLDLLPNEKKLHWPDYKPGTPGRKRAVQYAYLLRAKATPGFWHEAQRYSQYMSAWQTKRRLREDYFSLLPELPEGQLWEFKICQHHEVPGYVERNAEGEPVYGTAGVGEFFVMVRVAPLGFIDIQPEWFSCIPHELTAHMLATNSPGDWQYIGWRKSESEALHWKDRVQIDYLHIFPPRTRSELIPDFEYGYEEGTTTGGDKKVSVYVKYIAGSPEPLD